MISGASAKKFAMLHVQLSATEQPSMPIYEKSTRRRVNGIAHCWVDRLDEHTQLQLRTIKLYVL